MDTNKKDGQWLKDILEDATRRVEELPEWARSPDYREEVKRIEEQRRKEAGTETPKR